LTSIEPDPAWRSALGRDERLLALREVASIDLLPAGGRSSVWGRLAITTERLIMIAGLPVTLATLEEFDDVTLVTDRLLVLLKSGVSFTIQASQPRLLRVQLAEARASRSDRQMLARSKVVPEPAGGRPRR
jgi:hypothetical protein